MPNLYILIFSILFLSALNAQIPSGKERIVSSNADYEQEVLKLINTERKKRSLQSLIWNEQLANAARYHANDMAREDYFNHDSHDRKNNQLKKICGTFERMKKFLSDEITARSENIGAGQVTPRAILESWMKSPGHKKNILDKDAKYIGVGYVKFDKSKYAHYWVMNNGL